MPVSALRPGLCSSDNVILLPGGVMVAPENLDLVVQVRVLAGQRFFFIICSVEHNKGNCISGRPGLK